MSEQAPPNTESSEVEVAWVRDNQMIIKYLQHWIPQFTNTFHTTLYHSVRYVPSSFIPSSPSSHPPPTFIPLLPSLLHSPPPSSFIPSFPSSFLSSSFLPSFPPPSSPTHGLNNGNLNLQTPSTQCCPFCLVRSIPDLTRRLFFLSFSLLLVY